MFHVPNISNIKGSLNIQLVPPSLHSSPFQGCLQELQCITQSPRISFEIQMEASMTLQLLDSACLQNQHHVYDSKVRCQLQQ
jgi:hypothetical protein